ncbi:MAG: hypothetical protein ACOX5X_01370 [Acholeplasmataceae bacterium]|jgi:hypothetical protein
MVKNVLLTIYAIFGAITIFLIGLILMSRSITKGHIVVKSSGETTTLVIDLDEPNNKKLVPFGMATQPDETDEIELKYRVYIEGGLNQKNLMVNIKSITIDDDPNLAHLIKVIYDKEKTVGRFDYYVIKIRLNRPNDQHEYEQIQNAKVRITLNFNIEQ